MAKRGYSREFKPHGDTGKRYLLDEIPAGLWADVKAKAKRDGISLRALILSLLKQWLEEDAMREAPSVQQALHDLICAYDSAPVSQITALIAAVRAESGHHTLAQGERLMEWRDRAEAAEAENQRLRAQLAQAAQGTAWRDIATAPKDGTPVLVRGRLTHTVNTATCRLDYHATRPWCDWDGRDPLPIGDEPTHWMPMPPPPTEADR